MISSEYTDITQRNKFSKEFNTFDIKQMAGGL